MWLLNKESEKGGNSKQDMGNLQKYVDFLTQLGGSFEFKKNFLRFLRFVVVEF